jgi:hypothetical protein
MQDVLHVAHCMRDRRWSIMDNSRVMNPLGRGWVMNNGCVLGREVVDTTRHWASGNGFNVSECLFHGPGRVEPYAAIVQTIDSGIVEVFELRWVHSAKRDPWHRMGVIAGHTRDGIEERHDDGGGLGLLDWSINHGIVVSELVALDVARKLILHCEDRFL